ncbi:MAG: phospholipid carrier-dependent glycosyltransferase [Candidatus Omnitrophica bacterium]|nr:phospholipid carrier-dependent glycosyltransferase [Candidatus Omnitrophota bacterium]
MKNEHDRYSRIFFLIVAAGLLLRLININMPILEGTAARQVQTAMITRNLFRNGYNIFYPQVDFFGPGPGYLVLEFPLFNLVTALLYGVFGGVREWLGRLVSVFFFLGTSLFTYGIARSLFNRRTALISFAVITFSPLSIIFSRAFMPDFEVLFFSAGAIYFLTVWAEEDKARYFGVSAVFASLSLLCKAQSFYIALPLGFILFRKDGVRALTRPRNYIYLFAALAPALLWYLRARGIHLTHTEGLFNYEVSKWFQPAVFFGKEFYFDVFRNIVMMALTPVGFTFFLIGLFVRGRGGFDKLPWAWMAGVALFYVVFNTRMYDPYYNLPFLPVAAVFAGRGADKVFGEQFLRETRFDGFFPRLAAFFLVAVMVARYAVYAFVVPAGYAHLTEASARMREISDKGDLVVASSSTNSAALYYSDRKGWAFGIPSGDARAELSFEKLRALAGEGAEYFLVSSVEELNSGGLFREMVEKNYTRVAGEKGKYAIYSLEE